MADDKDDSATEKPDFIRNWKTQVFGGSSNTGNVTSEDIREAQYFDGMPDICEPDKKFQVYSNELVAIQNTYATPEGKIALDVIVSKMCLLYRGYPLGPDANFMAGRQFVGRLIEQALLQKPAMYRALEKQRIEPDE